MSLIKKEKVLVFPGEEHMIVRTRPPYRYLRKKQEYLSLLGDPEGRDLLIRDDGGTGGSGDPQQIPDYVYPDWNSLSCPDLMTEIGKLEEWQQVNISNGLLTPIQSKTAMVQFGTASQLYASKCNIAAVPIEEVLALVKSIAVSGTATQVSATVQMSPNATGFHYQLTGSTGYSKTADVSGNQLTLTDNFPAGNYTFSAKAMIGSQIFDQSQEQNFTIEAAKSDGTKDVVAIPVIPVIASVANTAMRSGGGGGGGGGGSSSTASKSTTTVKPKANYWWLLLIAAAGTTYYIYKKNKKSK